MARNSRKTVICALAMKALSGRLTEIPEGIAVEDVLGQFENMGGVKLSETPQEIKARALQYCDSATRISYMITNRIHGEIHIAFLLDFPPENPARTEADRLKEGGAFAYVYNVQFPHFSELGDIWLKKRADGYIYRIA